MVDTYDDDLLRDGSIHRLNLNLLYPLDAILRTPTLTEAGRRVRLSPSSMSHALRRLRDHFGDDLVTHAGGKQQLTPLGMALRTEVRRVLNEINSTFSLSVTFDPLASSETIIVGASDAIEQMLLAPVLRKLSHLAPGISIKVVPLLAHAPQRMLERTVDLLLLPEDAADESIDKVPIITDRATCMVWAEHPDWQERLAFSEEDYRNARHIVAQGEATSIVPIDQHGADLLRTRHVRMWATSQAALPAIVIGSDLVATGSSWLFQYYASMMPVKVISAPFASRETKIVAQCAAHRRRDPMLAWFINQVKAYTASFAGHI